MAERAPFQRWGVVNVLMRLKNKIREKFFCDRFLTDLDLPRENEDSASTHPNFQYYDAMGGQADESPGQFQTFTAMLEGNSLPDDFLTLADFDMDDEQQQQTGLPTDSGYADYGCAESEYYVDARMEFPGNNHSATATTTTTTLSRVATAEMMDTGDSSTAMLQPAEWQQIMFLRQFLEIDDGVERAGAGWRVVLGIVSAFRRISGLIRNRRELQRTASVQTIVNTARRIGHGSTRYKGIRPRRGKWVSEIRIGGTLEKVWLGSYNTEKEAALAFDAGKHHCSARRSGKFNFADSPRLLGAPENLLHLSSVDRRERIQRLVEDYVRAYGNADIR